MFTVFYHCSVFIVDFLSISVMLVVPVQSNPPAEQQAFQMPLPKKIWN